MSLPERIKPFALGPDDERSRQGILIPAIDIRPPVEPVETRRRRNQDQHVGSLGNMDEWSRMYQPVAAYDLDSELVTHPLLAVWTRLPLGERLLPTSALVISDLPLDHIFIGRKAADGASVPHGCTLQVEFHHRLAGSQVNDHHPVRMGNEYLP